MHRIRNDVRRQWKCPRCGMTVRTGGHVASRMCRCDRKDPVWMQLIDLPVSPIVIPDPGEEPQRKAELLLTSVDLTTPSGELPELPKTLTMHDTLTAELAARAEAEKAGETSSADDATSEDGDAAGESAADGESGTEDETDKPKKKRRRRNRRRRKKKS